MAALPFTKTITAEFERRGFAFLPEHRSTDFSAAVISSLGSVSEFALERPIHQLSPKTQAEAPPNTYSGRYGHGVFPLHTDFAHWPLPPRIVLLRCVVGHDQVATMLLDGHQIEASMDTSILFRALVQPRRPLAGKLPLLRLLSAAPPATRIMRWDSVYLRAASEAGRIGLAALAQAIDTLPPTIIQLGRPGDTLIIDNWRMLHGRSAVPPSCTDRLLQRSYLEALHG